MIIKKIESTSDTGYAAYVYSLIDYMIQPQKIEVNEKVLYTACRGCTFNDIEVARVELAALADGAKRGNNPTMHLVISWQEGEFPSQEEVDEAVRILLKELNLTGHSVVYALHLDTDNLHVHVAVSRVHPDTEKLITPAKGLDIEAIHKATARIEHAQGWSSERNSRYTVHADGQLIRNGLEVWKTKEPSIKRRDVEYRTGVKSAQRVGGETVKGVLAKVISWGELHSELTARGMLYQPKGSGAVIYVGTTPVKASDVHDDASFTRLQKRFGEFLPATDKQLAIYEVNKQKTSMPAPNHKRSILWEEYSNKRKFYKSRLKRAIEELKADHQIRRANLRIKLKLEKSHCLNDNWDQMGLTRCALLSVMAADHASQKLNLEKQLKDEISAVRKKLKPDNDDPFDLDFEAWLRAKNKGKIADDWRYHHRITCELKTDDSSDTDVDIKSSPKDIRSYTGYPEGDRVYYYKKSDESLNNLAFIDKGRSIEVCEPDNDDVILAAMQLAAQKFGAFIAYGDDKFKARCVEIAARHSLPLSNPELRLELEETKEMIRHERREAEISSYTEEWDQYFKSMQADNYQLTAVQKTRDGTTAIQRRTLGTGEDVNFSLTDIRLTKRRMLRDKKLIKQDDISWNISPLHEEKVVFHLRGATHKQLDYILLTGFKPRLVLETKKDQFDIFLSAPKDRVENIETAAAEYVRKLKRKFGVEGYVCLPNTIGHPLLKEQEKLSTNASIHTSNSEDCSQTYQTILSDGRKYSPIFQNNHRDSPNGLDLIDAYKWHHSDLLKRSQGRRIHPSRIDSQVCLRLKLSGHSRDDVKKTLISFKKSDPRNYDIDFYADRAIAFAWGPLGKRQEAFLAIHAARWTKPDGRADPII